MQMVVQGRWADDPPLANLPAIADGNRKLLQNLNSEGLGDVQRLVTADKARLAKICRASQVSEKETNEFIELVGRLPQVHMQLSQASAAAGGAGAAGSKSASAPSTAISPSSPAVSPIWFRVAPRRFSPAPQKRQPVRANFSLQCSRNQRINAGGFWWG